MLGDNAVITEREVQELFEIARKLPRFKNSLPFASSHSYSVTRNVKF